MPHDSLTITADQLRDLITAAVTAARAPDEETARRLAEEKANRERFREESIKIAHEEEAAIKNYQAACPHLKPDGRRSVGGQVHSDNLVHPFCLRCGFAFTPFPATQEQMLMGVEF